MTFILYWIYEIYSRIMCKLGLKHRYIVDGWRHLPDFRFCVYCDRFNFEDELDKEEIEYKREE